MPKFIFDASEAEQAFELTIAANRETEKLCWERERTYRLALYQSQGTREIIAVHEAAPETMDVLAYFVCLPYDDPARLRKIMCFPAGCEECAPVLPKMPKFTRFHDRHSGGDRKEDFETLYVELPQEQAEIFFQNRFGHNPNRVTCTCCGSDYSIREEDEIGDEENAVIIRRSEIKPEELEGKLKRQGYVWIDEE